MIFCIQKYLKAIHLVNMEEAPMVTDKKIIKYAKCCVNLYGIFIIQDLQTVIEHYDHESIDEKHVQQLLDNFITKRTIIQKQGNLYYKSNSLPEQVLSTYYQEAKKHPLYFYDTKTAFFYHESSTYVYALYPYGANLYNFLQEHRPSQKDSFDKIEAIEFYILTSFAISLNPLDILQDVMDMWNEFQLKKLQDINSFIEILIQSYNNSRQFMLHGHTPMELRKLQDISL